MNKNYMLRMMLAGGATAGAFASGAAQAVDFNITGFVRQEIAISVTDDENPFNASGNPFNGRVVPNAFLGNRTAKGSPYDNGTFVNSIGSTATNNQYFNQVFGRMNGACGANPNCGNYTNAVREDSNFNMFATRAEIDVQAQWTDSIKTFVKFRAFGEAVSNFSDAFNGDHFRATGGGWHGDRAGNMLEWNSPDFMVDIPSAYLDYNAGSLWVRVGQQQIAWGEAYFFRVFDVPNGLDTRRHFTLDVAAEEFSDKRVASPGVRASYTFDNGFEVDGFMQMFAPTTIVGTNTPYNIIGNAFSWSDNTGEFDEAENSLNFGVRLNMPLTDKLTVGVMAVNRRNPDGVVRWDDAPTVMSDGTANPFCFGPNNAGAAALRAAGLTPGTAPDLNGNGVDDITEQETPLAGGLCGATGAPDPMATGSWAEWHTVAGKSRLNPVEGGLAFLNGGALNPSGTNASALAGALFGLGTPQQIFDSLCNGAGCAPNTNRAAWTSGNDGRLLDAFFNSFAFTRGYITREFKRENIFGASFNYIFEAEPGSLLDQLIIRGEVSYTPDKKFTALDLRGGAHIESDEVASALILEKYHSLFENLPATYLVAQWMHKTDSDLFGRHLGGMQHEFKDDMACMPNFLPDQADDGRCGRPEGNDNANYVSFAFQQPFPNLIWRADFAMLIDIQGGVLLQPGLRYKPSTDWQFDLYANILQDFSEGQNDDVIETLDFADEVFARVSFFF